MQLPPSFLDSLNDTKGFDKEAFEKVHASGEQITSIRINPGKLAAESTDSFIGDPTQHSLLSTHIPWTTYGRYLNQRPSFTFDPLFHAGCYYVQEASSMFLEQALQQTTDLSQPLKILDLSAAPGGKSTHIQSLMSKDSLLVSNEVIRARANILKDNIIKWGGGNVMVTNNDPRDFAKLENYFDVIVVDAPCSGSGLFRRDPEAINEWSLNNVTLCSQRQKRILADVWPALKKNGILIYSTCSYSNEEDEEILDWIMQELRVKSYCFVPRNDGLWVGEESGVIKTISASGAFGYRFWPDKVKGEGFFIACFQKEDGEDSESVKARSNAAMVTKNELAVVEKWVEKDGLQFIKYENTVYAWPDVLVNDMNLILSALRVIYSGVRVGELIRDKLVPDHALAMSGLVADTVVRTELNYDQAIQYLQRKDLQLETKEKGWQLVNYQGHPIGWINALPNRINNYYPKELRILKDTR